MTTMVVYNISAVEFASLIYDNEGRVGFYGGVTMIRFVDPPKGVVERAREFLEYAKKTQPDYPNYPIDLESKKSPYTSFYISSKLDELTRQVEIDTWNKTVKFSFNNTVILVSFSPFSDETAIEKFLDIFKV